MKHLRLTANLCLLVAVVAVNLAVGVLLCGVSHGLAASILGQGSGAGAPWSDAPATVHPALARVARRVNDATSDTGRRRLAPLAPLLVGTAGASIGQRVVDLRVETVAGGAAGPIRAAIRAVLLCLVVPALIWDRDQRGLHDKAAGTVLVRR